MSLMVLQQESVECGLACIVMLLKYYGSTVSLDSLRKKFDISLRGTSIAELVRIATALNFDSTVYLLTPEQLGSLKSPAILHWNGNHYVVLEKIHPKRGFYILDPANSGCWLKREDFVKHYSGYAISLKPTKAYQLLKENKFSGFKSLVQGIPKILSFFWFISVLTLLLQLLVLAFPCYIQRLIDPSLSTASLKEVIHLSLVVLLSFKICEAILHYFRGIAIGRWEKLFTEYFGFKVLTHILHLPLNFFEKRSQSAIYSRFNSIDKAREILSRGFAEGLVDGIFSIFIIGIIYLYNIQLGLILSTITFDYIILNHLIVKKARSYNEKQIKQRSKEASFLFECLRGLLPIKIFSRETHSVEKWFDLHRNHLETANRISNLQTVLEALRILVFGLQITIVTLISLNFISAKLLTLGGLYALLFYINILNKNISNITNKWFDMKILSSHAEQISNLLSYNVEKEEACEISEEKIEHIELRNVSFKYHANEPWVLRNISLKIKADKCIMLYGPSGFGKSTLLKILMGLVQPTSGEILVNDVPLNRNNLYSYRKRISAVMQDDELFSGTIYENISFFDKEINYEKVHRCAKLSGIAQEIESMPMGYHSYVGDMGVAVSGGQKQRILLARALYFDPNILFLDEAFSNLDIEREKELSFTLNRLGITQFIITHRRESLCFANEIIDIRRITNSNSVLIKNIKEV